MQPTAQAVEIVEEKEQALEGRQKEFARRS
jgi:hypothetical protein